jgi:hypothetical protein
MAAGSIIIDLLMRTGSFVTDTGRATKSLKELRKEADATARGIKASFAGNLLADFAQQFGSSIAKLPAQILDGLDALNDLADATGASVENLSALESVANRNGQTLEDVGGILVKFNKAISDTDPKSPISLALKQIGLDAAELRKQDPAEALRTVAIALQGYAADGDKARLVQELFGKSIKEAGPFLKDLAEAGQLNAKVTSDQAQAAEDFNKAIFALQTSTKEAARALIGDLLPAVNDIIKSFLRARETGESMFDWLTGNTAQNKISGAAVTLSQDIARATDAVTRMQEEFDRGGGSDTRLALRISKAKDRIFELQKQAQAATGALKSLADAREPIVDPTNFSNERDRRGRSVGPLPRAPEKEKKAKPGKDPDEQVKAFIENQKELARAAADAAQAQEQQFLAQQKALDGFEEERKAAEELSKTFGFTREELERLNVEKLRAQAASLDLLATTKEEKEGNEEIARLYRQQAEAIRATAKAREELARKQEVLSKDPLAGAAQGVKDYLDEISRAGDASRQIIGDAAQGLEDVLSSKDPKQKAKQLVNDLIQEFYRLLVIKPLMKSILGDGAGGGGFLEILKGIFGLGTNLGAQISPQLVGEFAGGSRYVPRTGLALVHEGEQISRRGEWGNDGGTLVQVVNNTGAAVREERGDQGGKKMVRLVIGELGRDSRRGGAMRQITKEAVGPRPRRG